MEFTLTPEEADALRHMAAVEPLEARTWLQDRPELAKRMLSWPPELRLEVSRILLMSFDLERRQALRDRSRGSIILSDLLLD